MVGRHLILSRPLLPHPPSALDSPSLSLLTSFGNICLHLFYPSLSPIATCSPPSSASVIARSREQLPVKEGSWGCVVQSVVGGSVPSFLAGPPGGIRRTQKKLKMVLRLLLGFSHLRR
eukprot:TRINITY_DN4851_c1_g1_i1.p1 TRINITY_DN4851_c1_g1~~TRINITY_DN4851_c1_g1_i1.p1  ORF type:complete len:118 (+),score=16.17 TRINITY_DN4851_c1_g1_i1:133-486(+)